MLPVILVLLSVCCVCAIILFSITIFELNYPTCRLIEQWVTFVFITSLTIIMFIFFYNITVYMFTEGLGLNQ